MTNIDSWVMGAAKEAVRRLGRDDIHTITLVTNGQHGGVDMTAECLTIDDNGHEEHTFRSVYGQSGTFFEWEEVAHGRS